MGFERLEPHLKHDSAHLARKGTVVMATVQGDIHDIGKNIVCLMLRNEGFNVIDLGKDVSDEDIIKAALDHKPDMIGLSALMTTTMVRMGGIIEKARKRVSSALSWWAAPSLRPPLPIPLVPISPGRTGGSQRGKRDHRKRVRIVTLSGAFPGASPGFPCRTSSR